MFSRNHGDWRWRRKTTLLYARFCFSRLAASNGVAAFSLPVNITAGSFLFISSYFHCALIARRTPKPVAVSSTLDNCFRLYALANSRRGRARLALARGVRAFPQLSTPAGVAVSFGSLLSFDARISVTNDSRARRRRASRARSLGSMANVLRAGARCRGRRALCLDHKRAAARVW